MPRPRQPSPQTRRLLVVLLGEPLQWRHGYVLSRASGLSAGTLYPLLRRLKERGMLESRWEQPSRDGRPPRHLHRLSARGVEFARGTTGAA